MKLRPVVFIVSIISLGLFFACSTQPPSRYRGSLSDAMEKARDDSEDRTVPNEPNYTKSPWETENSTIVVERRQEPIQLSRSQNSSSSRMESSPDDGARLGGYYAVSFLKTGDVVLSQSPGVLLNFSIDNLALEFNAGLQFNLLKPGSDTDLSLKSPHLAANAGVELHYLFFAEQGWINPWLGGGLGGFLWIISFRNAIYADGEKIDSDSIFGLTLWPALGVDFFRSLPVSFTLFFRPTVYIFDEFTSQGFYNDVYGPHIFSNLGASLYFKID